MVQFEPFECYCVTNSDYGLLAILGTYATIDYAEIKLYHVWFRTVDFDVSF